MLLITYSSFFSKESTNKEVVRKEHHHGFFYSMPLRYLSFNDDGYGPHLPFKMKLPRVLTDKGIMVRKDREGHDEYVLRLVFPVNRRDIEDENERRCANVNTQHFIDTWDNKIFPTFLSLTDDNRSNFGIKEKRCNSPKIGWIFPNPLHQPRDENDLPIPNLQRSMYVRLNKFQKTAFFRPSKNDPEIVPWDKLMSEDDTSNQRRLVLDIRPTISIQAINFDGHHFHLKMRLEEAFLYDVPTHRPYHPFHFEEDNDLVLQNKPQMWSKWDSFMNPATELVDPFIPMGHNVDCEDPCIPEEVHIG